MSVSEEAIDYVYAFCVYIANITPKSSNLEKKDLSHNDCLYEEIYLKQHHTITSGSNSIPPILPILPKRNEVCNVVNNEAYESSITLSKNNAYETSSTHILPIRGNAGMDNKVGASSILIRDK